MQMFELDFGSGGKGKVLEKIRETLLFRSFGKRSEEGEK